MTFVGKMGNLLGRRSSFVFFVSEMEKVACSGTDSHEQLSNTHRPSDRLSNHFRLTSSHSGDSIRQMASRSCMTFVSYSHSCYLVPAPRGSTGRIERVKEALSLPLVRGLWVLRSQQPAVSRSKVTWRQWKFASASIIRKAQTLDIRRSPAEDERPFKMGE